MHIFGKQERPEDSDDWALVDVGLRSYLGRLLDSTEIGNGPVRLAEVCEVRSAVQTVPQVQAGRVVGVQHQPMNVTCFCGYATGFLPHLTVYTYVTVRLLCEMAAEEQKVWRGELGEQLRMAAAIRRSKELESEASAGQDA